jgi:hypothetical protein
MRRLFSTFARGAPGAALLLMRVVAGATLIALAAVTLAPGPAVVPGVVAALSAGIGILLLLGLWTPIAGALTALVACGYALSSTGDAGFYILLATLGAALALLGPGAWSMDARLFGWRRVEIRDPKGEDSPPLSRRIVVPLGASPLALTRPSTVPIELDQNTIVGFRLDADRLTLLTDAKRSRGAGSLGGKEGSGHV